VPPPRNALDASSIRTDEDSISTDQPPSANTTGEACLDNNPSTDLDMWCDNTDPDTRHDWEGNAPAARSSTREEIWKDSTEELRLTTFSLDDLSAEEESGDKEADEPISALPTEEEVQVKDAPADEARGKEILGDEAVRMRAQSSLSRRSVSMADIGSRNAKNRQMRRVNSRFLLGECGFVIRYEHRFLSSALSRFNDGSSRPLILNSPAFQS